MPQYVLASRRSGKYTSEQKYSARAAVATTLSRFQGNSKIVSDLNPTDELARRVVVFEADGASVASMRSTLPSDAMLEPLIRRSLHVRKPLLMRGAIPMTAADAALGATQSYSVTITAGGATLAGIQVLFYVQDASGQLHIVNGQTDAGGTASLQLRQGLTISLVEPIPYSGFWIMLAEAQSSGMTIDCLSVPKSGPAGWWHTALGIDPTQTGLGEAIRVGVIDTGCGPHPNLAHVTLAAVCVNNQVLPGNQATDVAEHGTHTSGLIGARPMQAGDYAGMAPACQLFHVRAFITEEQGPSQADIMNAIDVLSRDNACDLINMSLGGGPASEIEEDAIRDATQRGTLCVCSAGNEAGPIDYPAAYKECAAVSAVGRLGWAPAGTFSASNRPQDSELMGQRNLFLASFSCFGIGLACAAPGVGIISTVPDRAGATDQYMEMDGTSMASPSACGALAAILSADPIYRTLPRDISRTTAARAALSRHCQSIGLAPTYQGQGVPHL